MAAQDWAAFEFEMRRQLVVEVVKVFYHHLPEVMQAVPSDKAAAIAEDLMLVLDRAMAEVDKNGDMTAKVTDLQKSISVGERVRKTAGN